ncbi:hypothetical protein IP65_15765 [Novosphingobium sp. AAP1]|nr:hypothetical protein IP65_15765 [Novosphingobium sp. AAP1]
MHFGPQSVVFGQVVRHWCHHLATAREILGGSDVSNLEITGAKEYIEVECHAFVMLASFYRPHRSHDA